MVMNKNETAASFRLSEGKLRYLCNVEWLEE